MTHKAYNEGAFWQKEFIGDNSWNGYEHDALFRNDNDGQRFTDIGHVTGIDLETDGRGMTYLDYDRDGDLDVVVVGHRQEAILLRNDCGQKNNWLQVDLVGTRSNRQGVGARVTVRTGGKRQIRESHAGESFLSGRSIPLAFGLAKAQHVDELTVSWPSGAIQTLRDLPVNQTIRLVEPAPANP